MSIRSACNKASRHERSFILVITLIFIWLLSILCAGFLAETRLFHISSRSIRNHSEAEWLAQSCMACAQAQIFKSLSNSAGNPIYWDVAPSGIHPALVTSTNQGVAVAAFLSHSSDRYTSERDGTNIVDLNATHLLFPQDITCPAPWIYLRDSTNRVIGRFAYMVLDEQACLNPQIHGAVTPRKYGVDVGEIPLVGPHVLTTNEMAGVTQQKDLLLTPRQMGLVLTSNRLDSLQHLFATYTSRDYDIIPPPYPDAGRPKYNINYLATNPVFGATASARAANIASIIDRNLPRFKERDSSFAAAGQFNQYLDRLAANIVDYIDDDASPTITVTGEPAGRDLFPGMVALAEKYNWSDLSGSGPFRCTLENQCFVQIWNPYDTVVTGKARLRVIHRQEIECGDALVTRLRDYDETLSTSITLQPNEMRAVAFGPEKQILVCPTVDPSKRSSDRPTWSSTISGDHPAFEFYWNNELVDLNRRSPAFTPGSSGLPKASPGTFIRLRGPSRWSVCFIPTYLGSRGVYRSVGDPRFTPFCNYDWSEMSIQYSSNAWWNGCQQNVSPRWQNLAVSWADRDFVKINPNQGSAAGDNEKTPDQAGSTYNPAYDGNHAPAHIRNGPMLSIGELGHIFDPAQVDDLGEATWGGTPPSPFVCGGGRTLRIGQPEFPYWDKEGLRAMQLLDLFTTNPLDENGFPKKIGRININTASHEVLEALFQDVAVTGDPEIGSCTNLAEVMADTVIKHRPFFRLSDLHWIAEDFCRADHFNPALGSGNPALVLDRVREELFTRICPLITVQSFSFHLYGIGESFSPSGHPAGRARVETSIALVPQRHGTNIIFNPTITYFRSSP